MNLVGFDRFDASARDRINQAVDTFASKLIRIFGEEEIIEFKMVVDELRKKQDKHLYEIVGSLKTRSKFYHVTRDGWKVENVVAELINDMELDVLKDKEKLDEHRQGPANA